MSWIVEQSENAPAVNVEGDTITCTKDDHYGSPINVMYKDPADQNGEYFWQLEFIELDAQGRGGASVGLTTEQGFKRGWGLKAMEYLGNLSDGSSLLVPEFGDPIKQHDIIGILLQLTDEDLKMYIFHNDRPLGLAFHVQSPYAKPLYPVVGFNSNGKVKISRSQQIPSSLDRAPLQFTGAEGHWQIVDYSQHPECVGCQFEISRHADDENTYSLYARVVNILNCKLHYNPVMKQWMASPIMSTRMAGPPEKMNKEHLVGGLISSIQTMAVLEKEQLVIETSSGEQVKLERYIKPAPAVATKNIFSE